MRLKSSRPLLAPVFYLCVAAIASGGLAGCTPSALKPWPSSPALYAYPYRTSHWVVIKCTFSDNPTARYIPSDLPAAIPTLDRFIDLFLTTGGAGTGNLLDYYEDVTYHGLLLATRVFGWYNAPFTSTTGLGRRERVEGCLNSAPEDDVASMDLPETDGVIMVTNVPQDGGAAGVGKVNITVHGREYQVATIVFDSRSFYTAFAPHEVGHGLGMEHSRDSAGNEYGDPFDIMSAVITDQFSNPNYPPEGMDITQGNPGSGPGANLPNLLFLNAIPPNRLARYTLGSPSQSYKVTALSHPLSEFPLGIEIDYQPPNHSLFGSQPPPIAIYTAEYRQADTWDQGIRRNAVLVNYVDRFNLAFPWRSYLQGGSNGFVTGDRWTGPFVVVNGVQTTQRLDVIVQSVDPGQGTAVVQLDTETLFH